MTVAIGFLKMHALPHTGSALALWTVLCMTLGASNIPAFESGRSLPLWCLYPGVAAAVFAVSGASAAAWLEGQCARAVVVRGRITVAVLGLTAIAAGSVGVGAAIGVRQLWAISLVLAGVVLGAGTLHVALPFAVAFTAGVLPMVCWALFDVGQPIELLYGWFGPAGFVLWAVAGAAATAAYCVGGFRGASVAEV